jgi:hypothetical protein
MGLLPGERRTQGHDVKGRVSDKHRLMQLVDDVWTKRVPLWQGVYNDTDALALFWQRVRDTMQRETIFEDCVKSGIPRPELLHRFACPPPGTQLHRVRTP